MTRPVTVILGASLAILAAAWLRAAAPDVPVKESEELIRAKIAAARKTYEVVWQNNREGIVPFAELAYRWSRRWLEGELELSDKKADQVAARQAHRDRMRQLARITRDRYRNRVSTLDEAAGTDFYVTEAELWVQQARSK
jgi:hypothetical protein